MINLMLMIYMLSLTGFNKEKGSRIETFTLQSKIFNNERIVRVYLPKQYDGIRKFKILYLNDGQNLFGDNDFGAENEWRIDEIVDSLISNDLIEPIIIVGIDHAKELRDNEYCPWQDFYRIPALPNPEGKMYPEFLINEVMPLIEKKYKVLKGAENTGLGGASHGGLITLYTLLERPEIFNFAIVESPTLYVNNYRVFEKVKKSNGSFLEHIYVAMGSNESGVENCDENYEYNKLAVDDTRKLKNLMQMQFPESNSLFIIDSCAIHHETAWSKRFPTALKFVLNSKKVL